jgi:hypothetical protein
MSLISFLILSPTSPPLSSIWFIPCRLSNLYAFLATSATCPAHLIVFDVALIIIFDE